MKGDAALSWHLINGLVGDGFGITMCQEMLVDHAVTIPLNLIWPKDPATAHAGAAAMVSCEAADGVTPARSRRNVRSATRYEARDRREVRRRTARPASSN
jgi:hypothetical protein